MPSFPSREEPESKLFQGKGRPGHGLKALVARDPQQTSFVIRFATATMLVFISAAVRFMLLGPEPGFPYVAFFPAVIASAILLGRGAGLYAAMLSAAIAIGLFAGPWDGSRIAAASLDAMLFLGAALFTAAISGSLRGAYAELAEAHARADAGERAKDILLAELTHRIKNDIQRVAGLLRLEASATKEPAVSEALRAAADRVAITGRLHGHLARRDGQIVVDSRDFLTRLVEDLQASLGGLRPVGLFIKAEPHLLPFAKAGSLGLICNELVTNALKHAFPGDRSGSIHVGFRQVEEEYELQVADDGVGMQDQRGAVRGADQLGGGLGHRLVRALVAQLAGRLDFATKPSGGTVCTLRFPV
ncbi:sensor histidine kinase [Falsiroseomonas sp. E2-1-a20]|uniref:sensor histidine kinase n=1 Tax=Falsiroseomonas sp. E2-1-a20 TaxID=3239300 RepID=UPI003F3FC171